MKTKRPMFIPALSAALGLLASVASLGAAALQFDGVNDSVQVNDSASVSPTGPITVEAWINRATLGVQHSIVEKYGCTAGQGGYALRVTAANRLLFGTRDDCNNGSSVIGNIPIPANVWTHVAGSWDGTTLRVFVNGVTDTSAATTRNPKDGPTALKIGERGNGGTPFNGQIDDVRIWGVARTAAQIAANRNICLAGTEAGLRGYWRLEEGAGLTTADATVNGNTGTLINGPLWLAAGAITCGVLPPPPPPPGPVLFEAVVISAPPGPLTVPTTLFPNPVVDTSDLGTNGLPGSLPAGTLAEPFTPGGLIVAINGTAPNQEIVIDIGGGTLRFFYTHAGTLMDAISVGGAARIAGIRTLAPGPILAEEVIARNAAVEGFEVGFLYQGVVTRADVDLWTIGGADFGVPGPASVHPAIVDVVNPVLGVTEARVAFGLNPAVFPPPPPGAPIFDAIIIAPPVAATLVVPTPGFPGAQNDTEDLQPAFLPPGTIADVGAPAATVLAINGTAPNQEFVLRANGGTRTFRGYTTAATVFVGSPVVGDVVRFFGTRTLVPGPIVADLIRVDNNRPEGALEFGYIYQGIVTRADLDVWTIGGVDFAIQPVTTGHPTAIGVAPILNSTVATVTFGLALGVVLGPPTVTVAATDAAAAETASDPAVFTLTRVGLTGSPLTVNFTLTGAAGNGSDYTAVPLSATIPANATDVTVTITPIDDPTVEPSESVILTISANAAYIVGAPNSATANITDNDVAPPPPPPGTANALAFNGVNQSVQVPDSASVSPTGPITIEAWINRAATGVQHGIVEKYGCTAGQGGYVLRVTAGDKLMFGTRDDCNNGTSVIGATSIPANTWVHVAGHWDGAVMRVFVNGVLDAPGLASTRNPKDGPTAMKIGERGNGGLPMNGMIDEVRLWSVARTAAQISANRNVCIPVPTPGLNGYWKLDEAAGATAADSTANANTGNLVNGPTHVATVAPVTCP